MPVNVAAQLSTIIFTFPLVVFNSLSSVKSSSQTDQTWQHNNRGDFFVLFETYGLPFLFTIFMKVVSNSLLRRLGDDSKPPAWTQGSCSGLSSYLFSSDILSSLCSVLCLQPVSWLPVHSLKCRNGTVQLRRSEPYWRVRQDINKADQTRSRQRD